MKQGMPQEFMLIRKFVREMKVVNVKSLIDKFSKKQQFLGFVKANSATAGFSSTWQQPAAPRHQVGVPYRLGAAPTLGCARRARPRLAGGSFLALRGC